MAINGDTINGSAINGASSSASSPGEQPSQATINVIGQGLQSFTGETISMVGGTPTESLGMANQGTISLVGGTPSAFMRPAWAIGGALNPVTGSMTAEPRKGIAISGTIAPVKAVIYGGASISGSINPPTAQITTTTRALAWVDGIIPPPKGAIAITSRAKAAISGKISPVTMSLYGGAAIAGKVAPVKADIAVVSRATLTISGNIRPVFGSAFIKARAVANMSAVINPMTGALYGGASISGRIPPAVGGLAAQTANDLYNYDFHDSAWVLNTATGESTRYKDYRFRALLNIGGVDFGVRRDGFYKIDGDMAVEGIVETEVLGSITTKEQDFGTFNSKRVEYIYSGSDNPGKLTAIPYVDGIEKLPHSGRHNDRKVKLAKGNSGRYWYFEINGIRELDNLEYLYVTRQRRVK